MSNSHRGWYGFRASEARGPGQCGKILGSTISCVVTAREQQGGTITSGRRPLIIVYAVDGGGQGRLPRKMLRQSRVLGIGQVRLYGRTLRSNRSPAHCRSVQQPDQGLIAAPYWSVSPIVCLSVDLTTQNVQKEEGRAAAVQRADFAV